MATKKKVQQEYYGEAPKNPQQKVFAEAILNPEKLIVFCNACAGSGKTFIAVATANILVQHGLYDGIVYIVSPVQEEKSGFLPGDADSKTRVYTSPLYDALYKLGINPNTAVNQESIMNLKNGTGYIDCVSHLWLRGCNLENKICIIEESQNFYKDELKLEENEYLMCELDGYDVYNGDKYVGNVEEVVINEVNPLIKVNGYYIPLQKNFIKKVDVNNKKIICQNIDELVKEG